jgi:uncharacterized membrane protein
MSFPSIARFVLAAIASVVVSVIVTMILSYPYLAASFDYPEDGNVWWLVAAVVGGWLVGTASLYALTRRLRWALVLFAVVLVAELALIFGPWSFG